MEVLITGATGFVGRALVGRLVEEDIPVRTAVRKLSPEIMMPGRCVVVRDVDSTTSWEEAVEGVDAVVHLAARVHMHGGEASFQRVNVKGTRCLAEQAAAAGVRRLVFVSSLSVLGAAFGDSPLTEDIPPAPVTPYARSKLAAEEALHEIALRTGLEIVVVRPPLVYGPGNPGNLLRLLRWVKRGRPLPLARVHNRRSFIGIRNLVDFLIRCLEHPAAAGETFLVADSEAVSTPDLVRLLAEEFGMQARLFAVPVPLLQVGAAFVGMGGAMQRLTESCVVSSVKARTQLAWKPPVPLDEGLRDVVQWYREDFCKK